MRRSITYLLIAEVAAMSLWFVSAAILPDMVAEVPISAGRQAALSSAVQFGFVIGALISAITGIADRFDSRRVFALSALCAALANLALLALPVGGNAAIAMRFLTGVFLAGVYPVGMKIAVGWTQGARGYLVGALVGALTLGSAMPHLIALGGGAEWRVTVVIASVAALVSAGLGLKVGLGPYHAVAPAFRTRAIAAIWTNRPVRYAVGGYLGHMWELYAMWAWIGAASAVAYAGHMTEEAALQLASMTAFLTIGLGAVASVWAGRYADRVGKDRIAIWAMVFSASFAVLTAATFGWSVWLTFGLAILWGLAVIPDSAQFSALVADHAPPELAGSLMTLQTALGFALTIVTVQATPLLADALGWPVVLALMAVGPVFGIWSMLRFGRAVAR